MRTTLPVWTAGVTWLIVAWQVSCGPAHLSAEKRLRWRFQVGDRFQQTIQQSRNTKILGAPIPIASESEQVTVLDWRVEKLVDGSATIEQQVRTLRLKGKTGGQAFSFDSGKTDQNLGSLRGRLGPMLRSLAKAKLRGSFDAAGKVSNLTISSSAAKETVASVGGPTALSKDAVHQMVASSIVLPARKLSPGDTWESRSETVLPRVGRMTRSATYTYRGEESVGGLVLDKITLTTSFGLQRLDGKPSSIEIADQKAEGAIYFDNQNGYLVESKLTSSYTLARKVRGRPVSQQVSETTSVKMRKLVRAK